MFCAISGEAPEEPVVSRKTGTVYEKRLIEKYIEEYGKEPGAEDELDVEDLLPLKASHIVRPRPPTLTSIPALLATFQNEWDALALETYNLQEQLAQTRMELATALYQHDAAIRVIARLTKERDEARNSLSRLTVTAGVGGSAASNGDSMAVDNEELPDALAAMVDETHKTLSRSRKKRAVPAGWATSDDISSFAELASDNLSVTQATEIAMEASGQYAAIGGLDGIVDVYAIEARKLERSLKTDGPVTTVLWSGTQIIVGLSKGSVNVFEAGKMIASLKEHAGTVTGLAIHPSGRILVSVGSDKTIAFYDLEGLVRVSRAQSNASLTTCAFHPDGHLLAVGTETGEVQVYMTKTGEQATSFTLGGPVQAISFSENGYWIAAAAKGQTTVTIFDLRKEGDAATAKVLDIGNAVTSISWDYSAQFLATAGPSGLTVQQYAKGPKSWSQTLSRATPAVSVSWGPQAKHLLSVSSEGLFSLFGLKQ
ncbi:cell cycle control protein [Niveomyces insectorum RCEF 264]|uniref:Pre-mRNA-processing factor 19 n=1 Tax=Niveomyces insectorum RCEF 264 TaxID=1081102 RepID=A0A167ZRD6_9HYPO|nr:cell cycle control protein [Niveomyces insectorum RCEF 264]